MRKRTLLLTIVGLTLSAPTGAAAAVTIEAPSAHGVVHLGQRIQMKLSGSCAKARAKVWVRFGDAAVAGPRGRGCSPVVTVPTEAALKARGYRPGQPLTISVTSMGATRPMTFWRLQPTGLDVVTDPFEGLNGAPMEAGDAIDLGRVDLARLQSVSVRNLGEGLGAWELRAGNATGPRIASGWTGTLGSLLSAGADGWYHSVVVPQRRPAGAPKLFLVMVTGSAIVNFVDLNGPGAGLPHRFADDERFETLFDGSTFDGWAHSGPGRFELKEGAMRAEHALTDRGWGWQWWTREEFTDFVLRLRFKVEDFDDNGGVLLRHIDPRGDNQAMTDSGDEIQIQEDFENHTGGVAHEADAFRLATNMVGEWNDLEIVAVGSLYVIRVNGTEVQRFTSKKLKRGFVAVENEQLASIATGHLWYDDIRVHRCGRADRLCGTG